MTTKQAWERREGESVASFTRFMFYRSLGPVRTIDAAYCAFAGTGNARKRTKTPKQAPANWKSDAVKYEWADRAAEFDVANLELAGEKTVAAITELVTRIAVKTLRAMDESEVRPENWADVLKTLEHLATYAPSEHARRPETAPATKVGPRLGIG